MATSNLVQHLTPASGSPFEGNRSTVETFLSNGTIVAGAWVGFDLKKTDGDRALYVVAVTGSIEPFITVGVALDGAPIAGLPVRVVVDGYCEGASVDSNIVQGGALIMSGATAGRASNIGGYGVPSDILSASFGLCGIALETAVANKADVMVRRRIF